MKLMVDTGLDAYRFSISWSRVIPSMVTNFSSLILIFFSHKLSLCSSLVFPIQMEGDLSIQRV